MPVRVLVVDDSVVVRRALSDALAAHPDVEVVGTAADGRIALRKIADLTPDVVVLDIEMPVMGGMEALAAIRECWPDVAVIMFSTITEHGATVALDALSLGAVDYATKPTRLGNRQAAHEHIVEYVLPRVLLWGNRGARRTVPARPAPRPVPAPVVAPAPPAGPSARPTELIVLGSSTGGPDALARLLPRLPADLQVPLVIVQHMPPVFTTMLASRLDALCSLPVTESESGTVLRPGTVHLAAGGFHLEVHRERGLLRAVHTEAPKENSCRPAVDVTFRTAAAATSGRVLAVVLTGMGQDGLLGSRAVVGAGGSVVVQDEATSVVWGMPGYVARDGIAAEVLPLEELALPMRRAGARQVAGVTS